MKLHGDNLQVNQVVTVNGKMVTADVKELDTEEGYIDIFLPVFDTQETFDKNKDFKDDGDMPLFDYQVKRLTGEIKIIELTIPKE